MKMENDHLSDRKEVYPWNDGDFLPRLAFQLTQHFEKKLWPIYYSRFREPYNLKLQTLLEDDRAGKPCKLVIAGKQISLPRIISQSIAAQWLDLLADQLLKESYDQYIRTRVQTFIQGELDQLFNHHDEILNRMEPYADGTKTEFV